jgi:hypothetical protein
MTVISSLEVYRGGGDWGDDKEDIDDVDDDNESRFFRQDLRIGGTDLGRTLLARADDIRRITSSSGSIAGSGTLFSFGARGVPEPAEGFNFFKDIVIRS